MDTRKVTLIATIAVIALLAVGIGYAYTAMTQNTGNDVDSEYIVLKPSANGADPSYSDALDANVRYSTNNPNGNVTYFLDEYVKTDLSPVKEYQKVSSMYLIPDLEHASNSTTYKLEVSLESLGTINTANYSVVLAFGHGATKAGADEMAEGAEAAGATNTVIFYGNPVEFSPTTPMSVTNAKYINMTLYVKPNESLIVSGLPVGTELPKVLDDATFKFKLITLNPETPVPAPVAVTGVALTEDGPLAMHIGDTHQLTANVTPNDATNKALIWESNHPEFATVSNEGLITAVAAGSATITVTTVDGEQTDTIVVNVTVAVTGVALTEDGPLAMNVADTHQLTAIVSPANATVKTVIWSSDTQGVATVSDTGLITAVATGTAIISVTTTDGSYVDDIQVDVS